MPGPLEQLVDKLRAALGAELVSVILYGSAAVGDRQENFSDYNVLCVLPAVTPVQLASSEPVFRWWCSLGNPSPLLLTRREVETSTDCFAIEFHDIKENRRVLFGEDVVADLGIDGSFYRAQVEHELRSKLLRLRQKAAKVLSDKDVLCRLLVESVSTFCVLFRHALILSGAEAPAMKREIIDATRSRFAIDASPFVRLLDCREHRIKSQDLDPQALLGPYLVQIGQVIEAVDQIGK